MNAASIRWLGVVGLFLAGLGMMLPAQGRQAEAETQAEPKTMKVRNVVYLIHASIYEGLEKANKLAAGNYEIYREREKVCQKRWRQMIDDLGPDEIFVQLYGDRSILAYAKQKLGDRRVIAPSGKYDTGMPMTEYQDRIAANFRAQLKAKDIEMDFETVRWELAGESFEGCVYSYGGGMASSLGLKQPTVINFDWTVPDARFLCHAKLIETFTVEGSDVNGYVFDGPEGYCIGIFLPGLRDHKSSHVTLELADVSKVSVVNKVGNTLFSRKSSTRGCIGPDRDHDGIAVVDGGLQIDLGPSWYILGRATSRDEFRAAMRSAKVGSTQ